MAANWPTARELMTAHPITLPNDAPLSQALGIMRSRSFHEIPVMRRKTLMGMITFESIARRANLPLSTKVEHLLILPPQILFNSTYPEIAQQLLAAGLRAAPVTGRKGELIGVVSRTDLVKHVPEFPTIAVHRVEEIASAVGWVVRETDPVGKIVAQIRLLEEHPLPVVDRKGKLVGAVGIADLGQVLWRPTVGGKKDAENRGNVFQVEVGSIMHSPAVTVPKGTATGEAARLMARERVSSVFVVEDGKPTGVVSQADLLGLAVGSESGSGESTHDVYVQVTGLRGSSDPEILSEIDRMVAKGLRRIARQAKPMLLALHVSPQGNHRTGDAVVQARLHTDRGIFYASQTGWNFFSGINDLMEELEGQVRRNREERGRNKRKTPKAPPEDDIRVDPELEARIRAASREDD